MKCLKILNGHTAPVSFLSWSPNNLMILSCGNDNIVKLWEIESGNCIRTFTKHNDSVTSCSWFPDSKHFVSGGIDKNIFMMDIDGNEIKTWTCARINDLAISFNGKFMFVICQEKKIRIYNLQDKTED
jgi:WD40 repeat protein